MGRVTVRMLVQGDAETRSVECTAEEGFLAVELADTLRRIGEDPGTAYAVLADSIKVLGNLNVESPHQSLTPENEALANLIEASKAYIGELFPPEKGQ